MHYEKRIFGLCELTLCAGLLANVAYGTASNGQGKFYWTGASSPDVADAGNWLFGAASLEAGGVQATTAPLSNDYSAQMAFTENDPAQKRPTFFVSRNINMFLFEGTSGWVLGQAGSTFNAKEIHADAGCSGLVCTFNVTPNTKPLLIDVPKGASFRFNGTVNINGTCTVKGGGTVHFVNAIGGWEATRVVVLQDDSVALIDAANPGGAGVRLASRHAKLRLKSTVAAVTALFGKTANNSNGIANTFDDVNYALAATDIGDGFVEIALERVYIPGDAPIAITGNASNIGLDTATLNGTLFDLGTSDATASFRYGTDPEDLALEHPLGPQDTATEVSAVLSDLAPNTTYYFQFTATNESGTDVSEIVSSFTTRGAPMFGPTSIVEANGALTIACELIDAGISETTVTCLFGSDPNALQSIATWTPSVGDSLIATVSEGLAYGTTYYAVFQGSSGAYSTSTDLVSFSMANDFRWTGTGDAISWSDDANWSPAQVPGATANLSFDGTTASVISTTDRSAGTLTLQNGAVTTLDFTDNGFTLEDALTLAGSGTKLSFANGSYSILGLVDASTLGNGLFELLPGSHVWVQGAATFGAKHSQRVSNTIRMHEDSSLELPYATFSVSCAPDGWTSAGNTVYVPTGAVLKAANVDIAVPGNVVEVDGGRLEVKGSYLNGSRGNNYSFNGATLILNHGASMSVGTFKASGWYACKVLVLDHSVVEAGTVAVGTDADSGATGLLVVSNATLRANSLGIPSDDRHRQETMWIYQDEGETTSVEISGNVQVAVPNSRRDGNLNWGNSLNVAGGTVSIGGTLSIGNTFEKHTNNTLRVSCKSTSITAKKLTTLGDSSLEFTVPAGGFETTPIVLTTDAAIDESTKLLIDCTEYVVAGGGSITLLSAASLPDDSIPAENISIVTVPGGTARILQQENAITLRALAPTTLIRLR